MNDPWLRDIDGAWLQSPQVQGAHSLFVKDLMLPNVKRWDKEKIESLFPIDVVKRIIDIPLFDMIEEDKLIWIDSMHGQYSVKSGYHMLMNVTGRVENPVEHKNWSCLWKILAPPKVKHLLWRICKECVPTRIRLQDRCVSCPSMCPICEQSHEDDWHVFINCNDSLLARQAAGLDHLVAARAHRFHTLPELIFSVCNEEDFSLAGQFAMMLWILWQNRNEMVWNEKKEAGRSMGFKAMQQWHEWFDVQQQRPITTQQQHVMSWQKPSLGWQKCNVDAGFHHDLHKTSAGWCIRDHLGRFIKAGTMWKEATYTVAEGEALALLEAMSTMVSEGATQVIFETDSKCVVDAIHSLHSGSSEFSTIIRNVKCILLSNPNFMVKFIKRQANMVAHTLARADISWSSRVTFETIPLCITNYLNNEMM
jgi:ribonuclease HI